jgi:hypothetical protein
MRRQAHTGLASPEAASRAAAAPAETARPWESCATPCFPVSSEFHHVLTNLLPGKFKNMEFREHGHQNLKQKAKISNIKCKQCIKARGSGISSNQKK